LGAFGFGGKHKTREKGREKRNWKREEELEERRGIGREKGKVVE
jgi:hypothetical protein